MRADAVHIDITDPVLHGCQNLAERRIERYGRQHRNYCKRLDSQRLRRVNRIGVIAEYAVAHYLQRPWSWRCNYTPTSKDRDLPDIEVRGTEYANGHLLTHDDDWPSKYVLVTLSITGHRQVTCSLQGWLPLYECNRAERWNTTLPTPCYATPQTALHPIGTITSDYN